MITQLLVALVAFQDPIQVKAELIPSRTSVGVPVVFRVTADARGATPSIPLPEFPLGLNVVGTSESSATSIAVPGGRTVTLTREYVLLAAQAGYYPIPPIRITAGSRVALTQAVTVAVAEAVENDAGSDARIDVHMNPDTVFVGQQSTLVAEVLMSPDLQMRLTRPPSYQAPAPAEFWIQPLDLQSQLGSITRNGRRLNTQRFYRAYFPLADGRYSFAPARLLYEARQGFVMTPRQFELRSNSPRLVVLPLPAEGRPADYRGAVGRFTVTSSIMPQTASVGDAITLTFEIKGVGNIKSLPPPVLPALDGVEVLDPAESTEFDSEQMMVTGTKRFTWVLIPGSAGRIEVPALAYSSFDPATRTYVTGQTPAASIEVAAAAPGPPGRVGGLRARPHASPLAFANTRGFVALQLLPLLLLLAAWAYRRSRSGPPRSMRRAWQDALDQAQRSADPAAAHEQLIRRALFEATSRQLYRTGAVAELRTPLAALLGASEGAEVADLLDHLEAARFSRAPMQEQARAVQSGQVDRILDRIWQYVRSSSRAAVWPLLLLMPLTPQQSYFDAGLEAYLRRDLPSAVASFRQHVDTHPADASAWYNLGVAHNAQRQPAQAAFAFLKAAQFDPRAGDIQAELRRAGVDALGRRVRPATQLTPEGVWLVLAALWWLACILAAIWVIRRRALYAWLALAPLAAAGLVAAATMIERALPPPAIVLDQGASLLAGRNLHAETLRQLQPLTGLTVVDVEPAWVRVRTGDGFEGWVRADRIGRL